MIQEVSSYTETFSTPQNNSLSVEQVLSDSNTQIYSDLLMWIMENSENMRLSLTTKYHARVYFDSVLSLNPGISQNGYMPLFIACLAIAIKFHEKRQVSEQLTIHALMNSAGLDLSFDDIFQLEVLILQSLNFQLKFTSPEDYFQDFVNKVPVHRKYFQQALPSMILLALINPKTCQFTAEQIFYGSVLAALDISPISLTDSQQGLLGSMCNSWENAKKVREIIEEQTKVAQDDQVQFSQS